ncbi:MAG: hypothetical protein IJP44_06225 [Bacteroidales bacterium]|nr:hypothetical protein [Bacteroidales bacterium]
MKRFFYLFVMFLAMTACTSKLTEQVEAMFPNGQPQYVKVLDKSGNWVKEIEYYDSGQVKMEGGMKDGKREGEWIAYFPDGRPQSRGNFKEGKMDGLSKVYWDNGNQRWEGFYKEGRRCGKWKYFDEQGLLLKEADYGE